MLITCPTCASSYRIDAAKIGPEGRSVRCAACRETWFLTPTADEPDATAETMDALPADAVTDTAWEEATAAVRQSAEPDEAGASETETAGPPSTSSSSAVSKKAKPASKKKAKWSPKTAQRSAARNAFLSPPAIIALTFLAAVPLACLARTSVVGLVPQTASIFKAIGLPVNRRGLDIRDVVAFQTPADDDRPAELVVEGDLVGVGRADVPVPDMRVEISDAAGKALTSFPAKAPRASLGNGETARFRARLPDPPGQGRTIVLRFADSTVPLNKR